MKAMRIHAQSEYVKCVLKIVLHLKMHTRVFYTCRQKFGTDGQLMTFNPTCKPDLVSGFLLPNTLYTSPQTLKQADLDHKLASGRVLSHECES